MRALLCDRDGTLVADVPYNADPAAVRPLPGVRTALERTRAHGWRVGVVTNQSGVASGRITPAELDGVHDRLTTLLGLIDVVDSCVHGRDDGCDCRKPAPGLLVRAAAVLGVPT